MYDLSFAAQVMRKIDLFPVGSQREQSLKMVRMAIKDGKPRTVKQIAIKARMGDGCANDCLHQLKSYGEVEIAEGKGLNNATLWVLSRGDVS